MNPPNIICPACGRSCWMHVWDEWIKRGHPTKLRTHCTNDVSKVAGRHLCCHAPLSITCDEHGFVLEQG